VFSVVGGVESVGGVEFVDGVGFVEWSGNGRAGKRNGE